MRYLNQTDLDNRFQALGCYIGSFTQQVVVEYGNGQSCAKTHLNDLKILNAYLSILLDYTPITASTSSDDNTNCITEEEAQTMFDILAGLTGLYFQPIGYTY